MNSKQSLIATLIADTSIRPSPKRPPLPKLLPIPYSGAVLEANGKDWFNDPRDIITPSILDHKGRHPKALFMVPTLSRSNLDRDCDISPYPYTCVICLGTGESLIISASSAKHKMNATNVQTVDFQEIYGCVACAGKGKPPIPLEELK